MARRNKQKITQISQAERKGPAMPPRLDLSECSSSLPRQRIELPLSHFARSINADMPSLSAHCMTLTCTERRLGSCAKYITTETSSALSIVYQHQQKGSAILLLLADEDKFIKLETIHTKLRSHCSCTARFEKLDACRSAFVLLHDYPVQEEGPLRHHPICVSADQPCQYANLFKLDRKVG